MDDLEFTTDLERVLYEALAALLTCVEYVDALPGSKGHTVRQQAHAAIAPLRMFLARQGQ